MKTIAAVVALLVICSGCSATPAQPAPVRSAASASATAVSATSAQTSPAATLPDGVWMKTLTKADLKAFNVDVSTKEMQWAPDDTLVIVLKLTGRAWTQFANYNGGPQRPGDGGTCSYDTADNLVLTSPNGGSFSYSWHIAGGRLTLRMLAVPPRSSGDLAVVRMMSEGEWERATP